MLARLAPALYEATGGAALNPARLAGRASLRCVSPDYLPMVGPVSAVSGESVPGLYISAAHGSRGLITAPLAGEMLAAYLENEPAPVPQSLLRAITPTRFHRRPP